MRHINCILLIFVLLGLLVLPAPPSPAAPPDQAAGRSVTISDEEGLVLALELLNGGQLQQAETIYALLLQSRQEGIRVEAAFKLAQIRLLQEDYTQATRYLLAILNRHPGLARVRLELARAYFLDENYEDSRFHFELVKGADDIPPEVIANIDLYLELIRRKKNWSLNAGFSLMPDSNYNMASGGREECISTVWGVFCRPLEDEESGFGARFNLTGDHYLKLDKNFGIRSTAGLYVTEYKKSDYDDYILYLASGPRYIFKTGEISLQPTYMKRWAGGKDYSQSYGLRFDVQKDFDRLLLASGTSFTRTEYDDEWVNEQLKGEEYRFYLRPRYILSNRSFIQAELEYSRDGTEVEMYSSDNWTFGLGAYYLFKYGISVFAEASYTDARYRDEQYYLTRDYKFDSARRRDSIYTFLCEIAANSFEDKGIRPRIQYLYSKRDSNIWTRDYERHRVNFGLELRF